MPYEQIQASHNIYYRPLGAWISVTQEQKLDWERFTNTIRMKQRRVGRCCIPFQKQYLCDGLCNGLYGSDQCTAGVACPYRCIPADIPSFISIDQEMDATFRNGFTRNSPLAESGLVTEVCLDNTLLNVILADLQKADPEGYQILRLFAAGLSERESAERMHMPRNTYVYRRNRLLKCLQKYYF